METLQEFKTVIDEIKVSTDNIANDIVRLTDQLEVGGLTAAEETEVITELRAVAAKLKTIAEATPEPPAPTAA